jgi:hypothetical protein
MGLFTWVKGLLQPQESTIRVNCQTMPLAKWEAMRRRRGSNAPLSFDEWLAIPPPKIAAAINRHLDREIARRRGSKPSAPSSEPAAPAEMPSDELLEIWRRVAFAEYLANAKPTWRTTALLAIAWARQQQAQSPQLPPPGADPVATDGELLKVLDCILRADDARRALYNLGRADERTAILRALGVEP